MAPADDRSDLLPPARTATFAFKSPSLLMAAIAMASGLGSFGAVRAWFPIVGATTATSTVRPADASAAGSRDIVLTPSAEPTRSAGRLSIVTDPPGARVEVDGKPYGASPVVIDGLAAVEHLVKVSSDSGSVRRTIAVAADISTDLVLSMPQSTAPVAGWVAVASPFPVEVVEHGEVVGTSGASKIMLAAGKHDVVLRNAGVGFETRRTVDVAPGRVASLAVNPPKGRLNVNARPWADVLIDGEAAGQTPLSNLPVALGPHEITFRHPQLGERSERIVVTAGGVNRVGVDLSKPDGAGPK